MTNPFDWKQMLANRYRQQAGQSAAPGIPGLIGAGINAYKAHQANQQANQIVGNSAQDALAGSQNMPGPPPPVGPPPGGPDALAGSQAAPGPMPDTSSTQGGEGDETFASGRNSGSGAPLAGMLITSPTKVALGPDEAVVPLNNKAGNKVSTNQLGGGVRTRYRHVTGPNSISKEAPIRSDIPLIPNKSAR